MFLCPTASCLSWRLYCCVLCIKIQPSDQFSKPGVESHCFHDGGMMTGSTLLRLICMQPCMAHMAPIRAGLGLREGRAYTALHAGVRTVNLSWSVCSCKQQPWSRADYILMTWLSLGRVAVRRPVIHSSSWTVPASWELFNHALPPPAVLPLMATSVSRWCCFCHSCCGRLLSTTVFYSQDLLNFHEKVSSCSAGFITIKFLTSTSHQHLNSEHETLGVLYWHCWSSCCL